jgi:hypothetical protein
LQFFKEENKLALISCIEVVLMSMGNTKYNMVIAKLNAYNLTMRDSYKDLEALKTILKEVYVLEYNQVISEIKIQLGDLSNEKDMVEFFKVMES